MREYDKMIRGEVYDPMDKELVEMKTKAHKLSIEYSKLAEDEQNKREEILKELVPKRGKNTYFQGPINFDYGINLEVGDNFYCNFNFTILDSCPIKIGNNVMIGPNVSIYTALHYLDYERRNIYYHEELGYDTDDEFSKEVVIGDNCWIAGNVTILPGVHIGDGCVIGAGSVVTHDIECNTLSYGNPCQIARKLK